jgi:hypothetical protein
MVMGIFTTVIGSMVVMLKVMHIIVTYVELEHDMLRYGTVCAGCRGPESSGRSAGIGRPPAGSSASQRTIGAHTLSACAMSFINVGHYLEGVGE